MSRFQVYFHNNSRQSKNGSSALQNAVILKNNVGLFWMRVPFVSVMFLVKYHFFGMAACSLLVHISGILAIMAIGKKVQIGLIASFVLLACVYYMFKYIEALGTSKILKKQNFVFIDNFEAENSYCAAVKALDQVSVNNA